ncbi:antibiotic biosynthesis monooxygenase [Arhodomonas aquaeolei]|uniref:antibiotic biosynthesis monooxygenase n=1 Tax=Arhodomonas aquaeolei TaxID=2369 RepID=UPI00216A1FA6|nr:antibiotic biosynthesis monooxygenase [Arhodomonas aquaeolei]MCS4502463.1 antibiotic biosynthesis monooxygenase [Arhodomonas aquaeolei]
MAAAVTETTPGKEGPVTVSVARRVRPGCEAEYERWVSGIVHAAGAFPGHLGAYVLRPSAQTDNEYVLIYRFDTYAHCRAWEQSAERRQWIEALDDIVEGEAAIKRVTGLEFWFDLPEVPAAAQPSPHKMALTLTVVVYLMLSIVKWALSPVTAGLPGPVALFIVVAVQVVLLTYVVMPRVTRLLKGWLYG